jgi:hypothetical protein
MGDWTMLDGRGALFETSTVDSGAFFQPCMSWDHKRPVGKRTASGCGQDH